MKIRLIGTFEECAEFGVTFWINLCNLKQTPVL